ncbi:MarR family winged helix-turn-helix transcriptional regulator [Streptosporangium saharense]|uniref:MarR family winged helix-turn-helix transcriptional regulator n=1 Tax=Streptosporangium saharense TaxID=1706840 RepID=UPI00367E0521
MGQVDVDRAERLPGAEGRRTDDVLTPELPPHLRDVAAVILLEMRGPLAVGAIAEELGLPSASTTRLIDRLEKAGYVRRVRGERDRRTVTVELLEDGLGDYEATRDSARRHLDAVGARYAPEQIPVLLGLLSHIGHAYRAATQELRKSSS